MAKCRFPGKALKLNARKRIKFNWDSEKNPDELRVLQIKSGLLLFRQLFGDSDEENEFDGFSSNEALSNDRQSCSSYPNQKKTNIISSLPSQKTNYKNSKKVAEEKRKNEKEDQNKEKSNFSSELLLPVVPVVERRSSRVFNKAPKLDLLQKGPVVNGTINDNLHCDELNERLIFKRKKLLMKDSERISKKFGLPTISAHTSGERSSKKFILPTISAHSSRVIKPNMRIFSDMTGSSCANSTTKCDEETELSIKLPFILKPPVKFGNQSLRSNTAEFEEETEKDPVCRSITLYTDAITEQLKSSIGRGRPPKKVGRQTETQGQEELIVTGESLSPVKGAKEDKVKEKIEKLLRSPWDERLKQNASHVNCMKDPEVCISSASKTILRKARLNLNNKTLQKIRSPSSLQHLLPASETDSRNRKCGLCQLASFKTVICYGVSCCETCQLSVNCFIAGTFSSLICQGSQGACQLVGLSPQERCEACWLAKILATCAMPNLLHDSLRKQLPFIIKEKVPTSIGRSFNVNSVSQSQRDGIGDESNKCFSGEDLSCGGFGSLIDLPGGWKRKCGNEVIVLGPSGEKFRSISKLEEYLKLQGINADAGVLFGNLKPNKRKDSIKDSKHKSKIHNKLNNVVVTTLPGGWSRHMKWRHRGDKFDTYVCSPDGRTFRTRKDLLAYFHKIGKVDDMNKYFPLKSSPQSYSENSEASTMEPFSEASSEISTDKSVVESDSDREINTETRIGEIINDELRNSISSTRNYNLVDSLSTYSKSDADKISEKSSSVIISNFANSILTNSHAEGEDLGSTNNSYLNFQNEDSLSVSSISESFQGDSSAIDLNFLSDGKLNESSDSHFKYKNFDEQETQQLDTKLPNNLTSSTIFDMFKDRCKHKHKKHKKKKKKHHSHRKYEPGEGSNVCFNNMGKDCEEHVRSDNSTFKLNVNENYSIDEINKCNSVEDKNKIITQGAYEKEADSNSVKLVSIDDFLLSKVADISNDNNASETKCTNTDITSVPFVNSMDSTVLPSNSINLAQVIADDDIQKVLTPHPNDTWSTLLNHSSFEVEKPSSNVKCLSKEAAVTANLTEGNSTIENEASTPKLSLLAPKLIPTPKRKNQKSIFSKVKFGNGWHRKIKWNNEGQGKIVFLTSPDGQKIVSSIELLAYFKKAGKSMPKLEYYFPQNIVKDVCIDNVQEISANAKSLYIDNTEDSTKEKQSNDTLTQCKKSNERIMAKFGRGRGRRVLYKLPKSKFGKRALKQLNSTASDSTDLLKLDEKEQNCNISLNGQEEVAVHLDGGPRVKHVCRSQAQVLGMPRAVFPSPEGKTIARKIIYSEKKPKQYLAVATPKGKKILRKTIWCHKCPGCTTPNCKKCSNCLDMKKYGGPGTKKKPCIMRKCHNPFRAIKVSNSKENLSSFEGELSEKESVEKNELSSKKGDSDVLSIKLSSLQSSESDVLDDFESDKYLGKNHCNSTEKSIFIPKPLNRHNNDAKDRVDILEGKEFIPGARVNIDYWQDYDADEMLINGFPIITSFPLDIESLCFRCGSGGLEEMLYCIWCCEGVHPFCLEEGEGPESDEQETLWVCKKCTVCHVCGAPNDLMQCNDCRRHFHIECLGPLSHISCHTTSDGSWYCARCVKCEGCGNPNVVDWIAVCSGENDLLGSPVDVAEARLAPFCNRCIELRHSNNYCPICFGCYEDDDFDSKMMECGRCREWVHSHCEGLSDESYQILSYLPDSVEYICRICLKGNSSQWMEAVKKELKSGIQAVHNAIINSKFAKHLLRIDQKFPVDTNKLNLSPATVNHTIKARSNYCFPSAVQNVPHETNGCINSKFDCSGNLSFHCSEKSFGDEKLTSHSPFHHKELPQSEQNIMIKRSTTSCNELGSFNKLTQILEVGSQKVPEINDFSTVHAVVLRHAEKTVDSNNDINNLEFCKLSTTSVSKIKENEKIDKSEILSDVSSAYTLVDNSSLQTLLHAGTSLIYNDKEYTPDIFDIVTKAISASSKVNEDVYSKEISSHEVAHTKEIICCTEKSSLLSLKNQCDSSDITKANKLYADDIQICNEEAKINRRLTRSATSNLKEMDTELKIKNCSVMLVNIANSSDFKLSENSPCDNLSRDKLLVNLNAGEPLINNKLSGQIKDDDKLFSSSKSNLNGIYNVNSNITELPSSLNSELSDEFLNESCSNILQINEVSKSVFVLDIQEENSNTNYEGTKSVLEETILNNQAVSKNVDPSLEKLKLFQNGNDGHMASQGTVERFSSSMNLKCVDEPNFKKDFVFQLKNTDETIERSGDSNFNFTNISDDHAFVAMSDSDNCHDIESGSKVTGNELKYRKNAEVNSENIKEFVKEVDDKSESNIPLTEAAPLARVCKDIDDDCLSSEASSVCGSDTEIESIFEDLEEPGDLLDIKDKLYNEKYDSVLQYHIEIIGILETGKNISRTQTRLCRSTYMKLMKEQFPWFNVNKPNIFSLIDSSRPFPYPSIDHIYADIKPKDKSTNLLSNYYTALGKASTSPSISKHNKIIDMRKCILCNLSGDQDPEECGRLLYLGQDEWLHVNCGLWSSEVYEEEDGGLMKVYIAISRGRQIKCSLCYERGATVGCCHRTCQATFHFMCARKNNSFFGTDKRIFCNLHISSAGSQSPIDDLRVRRCVFVNMDSEKKRWKQVLSDKVNVVIGSLAIKQLGKMFPDLNNDDALIPVDFCCSRVYWSTKDPTSRVGYTCRTKRVNPGQYSIDGNKDNGFHKTIDHDLEAQVVEKEIKMVRDWQNEVDRLQLAIQSRQTNIIPPHMCPLYRNILKEERRNESKTICRSTVNARRKLFSPTPSNCSAAEEENVRLCLENIIEQISPSCDPHNDPTDSTLEDSEFITMVDTGDSNEIMSNIVSADDNEIISMVLRDLPIIESSAPHSPPSSGRASPLNLDFLNSYDQAVSLQDLHQKSNIEDKVEEYQCHAGFSGLHHSDKNFQDETEPEANLCQKIFDACDPQMQSQLLTMEHAHLHSHCSANDLQSLVSLQPFEHTSSLLQANNELLTKSVSHLFTDVDLPNDGRSIVDSIVQPNPIIYENVTPISTTFDSHFLSDFDKVSMLPYATLTENHTSLSEAPFCDSHQDPSTLANCSSEFLELNNYLIGAAKSCESNDKCASFYESSDQLSNNIIINSEVTRPDRVQGTLNEAYMPLSSIVNGLMEFENKNNIAVTQRQNSTYELEGHSSSNERSAENSSRESPFSALLPSSSSSSTPSVSSSKKQVCRVLPMPSAGSRRPSSASEHSDAAVSSSHREAQSIGIQIPGIEERCERSSKASKTFQNISNAANKKGKIRMKRNYRTVIKKYPLRSSLRKHSSFKSVQIEINETIEIPSEDDYEVDSKLKRKWSSTVTESNSAESHHDVLNLPSSSKKQRKRVFHASVNDAANVEALSRDKEGVSHVIDDAKSEISGNRSHQVLKFSDDHNDITVSIVNNNNLGLCDYSKRKRRHRFRRKTVLQLDGAADESSSEGSDNRTSFHKKSHKLLQSNLALHIKQQSLARSSPGEEGPYKCSKCKRLYRTKDSYSRHVETCTFEIDSSTPSDEDSENDSTDSVNDHNDEMVNEVKFEHSANQINDSPPCVLVNNESSILCGSPVVGSSSNPTDIEKLQEFCSSPILEERKFNDMPKEECSFEKSKIHSVHRQVRIAKKKGNDKAENFSSVVSSVSETANLSIPSISSEVFIPPSKSPVKFSPTVKKSSSPRKYTNVRLSKGKGYQYRRAAPQMHSLHQLSPQIQTNILQFRAPNPQQQQQIQQTGLPIAFQTLVEPNTYNIQNPFTSSSFQNPINAFSSLNNNMQGMGIRNHMAPMGQMVTVVCGPSVAVPQGYTLQYVGSYRDGNIGASTTNLLTYQNPQSVVMSPIVMTPQNAPLVMPPVVNSNITYAIAAPETLVINQPQTIVPNVQYITQPQSSAYPQQIIQPINNTIVPIAPTPIQTISHMAPSFSTLPVHSNTLPVQQIATSTAGISMPIYSASSLCSTVVLSSVSEPFRSKPQAFVAPITSVSTPAPSYKIESSLPVRPIFSHLPPVSRSVATVAPAVYTSSASTVSKAHIIDSTHQNVTTDELDICDVDDCHTSSIRPRPTYSYRDAMMDVKQDKKRLKSDSILIEQQGDPSSGHERKISEDESDSEKEDPNSVGKDQTKTETQSFKLVLKKDYQSGSKFNIIPVDVPNIPMSSPEVKELRIKAKVSVGPKRKKNDVHRQWGQYGKDFIIGSTDTTNEMSVNEQLPNLSLNFSPNTSTNDDPLLMDKPKAANSEPYIVFELTSEDGFKVESRHVTEVWQKVFDAVSEARENLRVGGAAPVERKGKNLSGLYMLGLTHNAVQYLLEQLPGAKDCHKYSFQFHRRPAEDEEELACISGCARTEAFKIRSPYDIFSWLASKHRKLPLRSQVIQEEIQLSTRRATSMELPMAMRYRHLRETAREAVGVFRSLIHGRGLFCKRDIDSGEMVIEYAGQVIRSCLCDMREKYYESKGIGCYMFRIDEETVIDATMHGNAARFINHSCDPNCYSRVVDILGKKHIIIFALRRILRGEELTYDYKFPIEDDKIPCSCGARKCRKYLN